MGSAKVVGKTFELVTSFKPSGDQPKAIEQLFQNIETGEKDQVLLGVTGSGKTFTMANLIAMVNEPALILAPNKTLAAQLYSEFKELFPKNAVEYFVSYYDYYQPEAYVPSTNTFIEKDSQINEQIDRMRHSATRSLFERQDVIIVSSVSCIYGLGSPEAYEGMMVHLEVNTDVKRDSFLRELIRLQYKRKDIDFERGSFRVRGDTVDIFPPYEEQKVIRVEFFGDYIDRISWVDWLTGKNIADVEKIPIYPGSHYVSTEERLKNSIGQIREDLRLRIQELKEQMKFSEAERIEQRTLFDIEIMEEMGFCQGIENYSRYLTNREAGDPPPTLLEYFPKNFMTFIDESHVTVPQIGGMYRGDRARKQTLVDHGFRLPSALDNRPLNFQEFETFVDKVIYVSATPGDYEVQKSKKNIVEQIIRPTGLLDPQVEIRPVKHQVDDLLKEIRLRVKKNERVLVTTLTKKSSEDLTRYYEELGLKVKYLHSDIDTVERVEIIRNLRLGVFDILIGINLLREGLDIPEVSLVAITDADKEGFLRSERSLIQTIGRAARNSQGQVILYADKVTRSIESAMKETLRRRELQELYNKENGIVPKTISKSLPKGLTELFDSEDTESLVSDNLVLYKKSEGQLAKEIQKLKKKMKEFSDQLEFEEAAKVRDEIKRLQLLQLELS